LKYSIFRKRYPEKTVIWVMNCIDNGIGYYDAKKLLFLKMVSQNTINETMFIYDKILNQMKGGLEDGRKFKRSSRKIESSTATTELPSTEAETFA
jgi:hypothetical protein